MGFGPHKGQEVSCSCVGISPATTVYWETVLRTEAHQPHFFIRSSARELLSWRQLLAAGSSIRRPPLPPSSRASATASCTSSSTTTSDSLYTSATMLEEFLLNTIPPHVSTARSFTFLTVHLLPPSLSGAHAVWRQMHV